MHEWPIGIRQTGKAERGCIASRAEYIGWRQAGAHDGVRRPFIGASYTHLFLGKAKYETDKTGFSFKNYIEHTVRIKRHYFKHLTHMSA